jgi:hypothetical protein
MPPHPAGDAVTVLSTEPTPLVDVNDSEAWQELLGFDWSPHENPGVMLVAGEMVVVMV